MQETPLVESHKKGKANRRAINIAGRNVSMAQKYIQMAAMDSPLFEYVVFYFLLKLHLIEETFLFPRRSAPITKAGLDFQSKYSLPLMFDGHE